MDLKNSQARQDREFRHLYVADKEICLLFVSVQPISLVTLLKSHF